MRRSSNDTVALNASRAASGSVAHSGEGFSRKDKM